MQYGRNPVVSRRLSIARHARVNQCIERINLNDHIPNAHSATEDRYGARPDRMMNGFAWRH